ncbi:MAG: hypothetical protein EAY75_01555 [Bacteroidetes bacterium]|nr:MAG: hypothetical protein EAY75_01555 [Bacteroidota bacterium]
MYSNIFSRLGSLNSGAKKRLCSVAYFTKARKNAYAAIFGAMGCTPMVGSSSGFPFQAQRPQKRGRWGFPLQSGGRRALVTLLGTRN